MSSLEVQIATSTGDGYTYPSSGYNSTDTSIYLGKTSTVVNNWLLFPDVTIPAGAAVNSAVIRHVANSSQSGVACKVKIYGEAADNPSYPAGYSDYWARSRTSAYASWTVPAWTSGNTYDSPDISAVIQEIINRGGWASGSAIQLFEQDDGSDNSAVRLFYSYDGSTSYAAKLVVTCTPGSTPKTSADNGSGSEAAALVSKDNFGTETGAGTDSGGILAEKTSQDSGAGTELGGLIKVLFSSDAGTGADGHQVKNVKGGLSMKLCGQKGSQGLPHKEVKL